jgi:hypothetical protein
MKSLELMVKYFFMKSEIPAVLKMQMLVFRDEAPCGLVGRYQRFGRTYCLQLQGSSAEHVCWTLSSKFTSNWLHIF